MKCFMYPPSHKQQWSWGYLTHVLTLVPKIAKNTTKKAAIFSDNCFSFKWCHQESNRGHKDFQSFALPTELWHRLVSFACAKVWQVFGLCKYFDKKLQKFFVISFLYYLRNIKKWRNVAQLVAHYVRDVGVGRSSRLIPTQGDKRWKSFVAFSFSFL